MRPQQVQASGEMRAWKEVLKAATVEQSDKAEEQQAWGYRVKLGKARGRKLVQ